MRKTRGMAVKSTIPRVVKTMMKPVLVLELRLRAGFEKQTPDTPPVILNIPRRPTMAATYSTRSIHALFTATAGPIARSFTLGR